MFEISEYIGIIAFAMSGFFVGVKNRLDLLGVLISTFLTALGGGVIRDVIVDRPPFTFTHTYPALTILLVMLGLIIFQFHKRNSIENKPLFILSDSIGLISFSISGAIIGLEAGFNLTGVIATSFITAVGGGIARDVIINEIPFVLKTGFYGTIAILIALTVYLLKSFDQLHILSMTIVFVVFLTLRLVAYYQKWSIPLK
ncbi:trimeric intracellular cation channel family protein [Sulfurimonas sp. C5]|uniref:trimeric intracellular cation channel family protein n=1 Tax=Sulfurimonas sp. C5 TaxID=3036947 RepID=UPI002457036D|nr:trimeric intracellular cation channel family protein [Sulfurimonas sp. C5]MDH4945017.1 trimeric intracellular cation channel family protein [Sulfurimonas sp. C5]